MRCQRSDFGAFERDRLREDLRKLRVQQRWCWFSGGGSIWGKCDQGGIRNRVRGREFWIEKRRIGPALEEFMCVGTQISGSGSPDFERGAAMAADEVTGMWGDFGSDIDLTVRTPHPVRPGEDEENLGTRDYRQGVKTGKIKISGKVRSEGNAAIRERHEFPAGLE